MGLFFEFNMKLSVFVVLLLAAAVSAKVIRLPFTHRPRTQGYTDEVLAIDAMGKQGFYKDLTAPVGAGSASLPLTNNNELDYTLQLGIGTPPQTFTIDPDTGSSNLWVSTTACQGCGFMHSFNASASSTYSNLHKSFQITYGSGFVSGNVGQDDVTIAGLRVKNVQFGAVSSAQGFNGAGIDGLMGLAYSSISSDDMPPVFDDIVAQNLVSQNLFSMFLSSEVSQPGELIFGGFCAGTTSSSFFFQKIVEKEWYVIESKKLLVGPTTASKINEHVTVNSNCQGNSNNPDITIEFENGKITLSPDQYIVQLQNQGQTECILGIQGASLGPFQYIWGDVPMRVAKCVAFDRANSQIGFAI